MVCADGLAQVLYGRLIHQSEEIGKLKGEFEALEKRRETERNHEDS